VIQDRKQKQFKGRRPKKSRRNSEEAKFDSVPVSIRRVTKVRSGSKRLRFSVVVIVGDKKGKVGVGLGRGADVRMAMDKATKVARKSMIDIPLVGTTIPHEVTVKRGAAKVFLKPALPGTGVIAGGAVRAVAEMAGIRDLLSKVIGTNNKLNNVYATFEALESLSEERIDGSWKVKPMRGVVKVETLAGKDKKELEKKRMTKKIVKTEKKVAKSRKEVGKKVEVKKEEKKTVKKETKSEKKE